MKGYKSAFDDKADVDDVTRSCGRTCADLDEKNHGHVSTVRPTPSVNPDDLTLGAAGGIPHLNMISALDEWTELGGTTAASH